MSSHARSRRSRTCLLQVFRSLWRCLALLLGTRPRCLQNTITSQRGTNPAQCMIAAMSKAGNWVFCYGYKELKEVERESGEVVKRIPVGIASGSMLRMRSGWSVDSDESRMSVISMFSFRLADMLYNFSRCSAGPSLTVGSVPDHPSSVLPDDTRALLSRLSRPRSIFTTFAPVFMDLIRHVDEEWDMFVTCIKDGTIPDLEGIDHVRAHLQVSWRLANMRCTVFKLNRFTYTQILNALPNSVKLVLLSPAWDGPRVFGQS
jgi:hypothetical protein